MYIWIWVWAVGYPPCISALLQHCWTRNWFCHIVCEPFSPWIRACPVESKPSCKTRWIYMHMSACPKQANQHSVSNCIRMVMDVFHDARSNAHHPHYRDGVFVAFFSIQATFVWRLTQKASMLNRGDTYTAWQKSKPSSPATQNLDYLHL